MIVRAVLCPSPPLLARELTGRADVLPELRDACAAAVGHLLAAAPDVVAVVGAGEETATWNPEDRLDLSAYAPGIPAAPATLATPATLAASSTPLTALPISPAPPTVRPTSSAPLTSFASSTTLAPAAPTTLVTSPGPADGRGKPGLPLALGIGALLLDEAGYAGPRLMQAVDEVAPATDCLRLGRELAAAAPRVALLAVGDGSTRRGPAAPGYLDERAIPFDDAVERAVRAGDMAALAGLDPDLARDLMATGRAAWQVLAGAFAGARPATDVRYADDPFGVAYLVAILS